jgi:flagellin-like protein
MIKQRGKKAVSPVLATLMMVAVAVALSVIIFTWSQSFLSQTSEAASGQQAAQNIAAQSGILIESATFATSTDEVTIYIRNVGAVSNTIGSIIVTGRPDNTGMKSSVVLLVDISGNHPKVTADPSSGAVSKLYVNGNEVNLNTSNDSDSDPLKGLQKGNSISVLIDLTGTGNYNIESGDVITIKVTTAAGTFAQATYTVP